MPEVPRPTPVASGLARLMADLRYLHPFSTEHIPKGMTVHCKGGQVLLHPAPLHCDNRASNTVDV